MGTANLVMKALESKEGMLAEKHLGLGGGKKQTNCALTAGYDQWKNSNNSLFYCA